MQAEVIDLLSGKGKFPTEQALVLAEAIDMAIEKTQFVTVPILDTRFAKVDVRFAAVEARFARLEGRMESGFVAVNARIDSLEARMEAKMERLAVRMVIAMLISQTALGPIGVG